MVYSGNAHPSVTRLDRGRCPAARRPARPCAANHRFPGTVTRSSARIPFYLSSTRHIVSSDRNLGVAMLTRLARTQRLDPARLFACTYREDHVAAVANWLASTRVKSDPRRAAIASAAALAASAALAAWRVPLPRASRS